MHGAGRAKGVPSLALVERLSDMQSQLEHLRHSNQLVTCDAEASRVAQGALNTQIALNQSETNVVLRDTASAAKTAASLETQLAARQARVDALQTEAHGAELQNAVLRGHCVDAVAVLDELAKQVEAARADFANHSEASCRAKNALMRAASEIEALATSEQNARKTLRAVERDLVSKREAYKGQVRALSNRERELDQAVQRLTARVAAEEVRAEDTRAAQRAQTEAVRENREALYNRIQELVDTLRAGMGELRQMQESNESLAAHLDAHKERIHSTTEALHAAQHRESDANTRLRVVEQRKKRAVEGEDQAIKRAATLGHMDEEVDSAVAETKVGATPQSLNE